MPILRRHSFFTIVALLIASMQTVLWPLFTGLNPAPQLWLVFIGYFILTRPIQKGVILSYYYAFVFSHFTIHPFGFTLIALFITAVSLSFFRDRLLGPGGSSGYSYLIVTCAGLVFVWHMSTWLIGVILDTNTPPLFPLHRIFDIVLTVPFGILLFPVLKFLDSGDPRAGSHLTIVAAGGDE